MTDPQAQLPLEPTPATTPRMPTLDEAWAMLAPLLGGDSKVIVEDVSSGDGYWEPHYEAWRASMEAEFIKPIQGEARETVAEAVAALAERLRGER